jgi:hypothetical protein
VDRQELQLLRMNRSFRIPVEAVAYGIVFDINNKINAISCTLVEM